VLLNKNRMMDNVQKHNICVNVPLSQTFRPEIRICQWEITGTCTNKILIMYAQIKNEDRKGSGHKDSKLSQQTKSMNPNA
jgi:hypothetical protein